MTSAPTIPVTVVCIPESPSLLRAHSNRKLYTNDSSYHESESSGVLSVLPVCGNTLPRPATPLTLFASLSYPNHASVSLIIKSPIASPQRPSTLEEQKHFHQIVLIALILYNSIILPLSQTSFRHWSICLTLGLILSALLQVPCIIKKLLTKICL